MPAEVGHRMARVLSFVCDCGVRLSIETEAGPVPATVMIPCPNAVCKTRHIVDGHVIQVAVIDADGYAQPYDWNSSHLKK